MKDFNEFVEGELDVKDLQSCVGSVEGLDVKDGVVIESGLGTKEENEVSRKRKRERYLPMLDWIKRVSKDPCDLAIGSLPERSKWKIYGGEHVWKQVLSAREARLLPTNVDPIVKLKWQVFHFSVTRYSVVVNSLYMNHVICITETSLFYAIMLYVLPKQSIAVL
ncbi:hypothetical protein HanHA300_Chr13g0506401 [Helianthus annuus]|nr:hypothetical protein HanHA300_Chr13g0506401 [Helianthus annuus]